MRPSCENPNAAPVLDIVIDDIFLSFLPKKGEKYNVIDGIFWCFVQPAIFQHLFKQYTKANFQA